MSDRKVSGDEALQKYLDRLKRTDPSPEVLAAIDEIEDEMNEKKSRPKKKSGQVLTPSR